MFASRCKLTRSGAVIDRNKCIPWVGRNLLAAMNSHYKAPRPTAEFLDLWRDALPETWREDAVLEHIQVHGSIPHRHQCTTDTNAPGRLHTSL